MEKRNAKGQFKKGISGNKKGKPKGAKNKTTVAALTLLSSDTEAITKKAIELALAGDTTALKLCMDRIAPPIKEKPIQSFAMPNIETPIEALEAYKIVLQQMACGELLPSEGKAICQLLDKFSQIYESAEIEQRVGKLEKLLAFE